MPLEKRIFNVQHQDDFSQVALEVFKFQYNNITLYREFCQHLGVHPSSVQEIAQIPFLPIEFFKSHSLRYSTEYDKVFLSSGTTDQQRSKHYVRNLTLYRQSFINGFTQFYGDPSDYLIAAILPGYVDNPNSSLLYMVDHLISASNDNLSDFYSYEDDSLIEKLQAIQQSKRKHKMIIGVTFALLSLAEKHDIDLSDCIILETGGMKGRRKEIVREELHSILQKAFHVNQIHSEYGMTELLSQAYSSGNCIFEESSTMKVLIRNIYQPQQLLPYSNNGGINIVDLSNLYSVSFLATHDLGRKLSESRFEVLGRFDHSDIRGCNLLYS